MREIIDVASDVSEFADALARSGVKTVIRYYNRKNSRALPSKRLDKSEAKALNDIGISLAVVFQQRGGSGGNIQDLTRKTGLSDAKQALSLAKGLGQPKGSAIYFAVDHDFFRASDLSQIQDYFKAAKSVIGAAHRIGVYGSGTVGRAVKQTGAVDLIWLAGAMGWSGSRDMLKTDEWSIFQKDLLKHWPGGAFSYDGNIASPAWPDFGQFSLSGSVDIDHGETQVLMEITARNGLKLRKGPGTEFDEIRSLDTGEVVTAVGRSGDWVKVDLEGDGNVDGFMHGGFMRPASGGFPVDGDFVRPVDVARAEFRLGVREIPGARHNPRIVMYHASTTGGAMSDETAWCSSFTNYCVEQVGHGGTDSKWAMSWHDLRWCRDVTTEPRDGDVAVFMRREKNSRGEIKGGHVGFWVGEDAKTISLLGGNQGNKISIRGYPKNGMLGSFHFKLLSIRRPPG